MAETGARRVSVQLYLNGTKAPDDINKHVLSVQYTDSKEKNADDLQVSIDNREKNWLGDWIEVFPTTTKKTTTTKTVNHKVAKGETIDSIAKKYKTTASSIAKLNKLKKPKLLRTGQVLKIKQTVTKTVKIKGAATKKTLKAVITQHNWEGTGKQEVLNCGVFDVDTIEMTGPPTVITVKAAAVSYSNAGSKQKRTRAFKNKTLKDIAAQIAKEDKCKLLYEASANPLLKRKEQTKQTNLKFLEKVCKSQGLTMKVAAKIIVIFDSADYGKQDPIKTVQYGDKNILSYKLQSSLKEAVYTKVTVSYKNGKSYKRYTYQLQGVTAGKTLSVKKKVNTLGEAKTLALKSLQEANAQQFKGTLTMMGNVKFVAGNTITLKGFEKFDGKYMISKATHTVTGGYKTALEIEQVI